MTEVVVLPVCVDLEGDLVVDVRAAGHWVGRATYDAASHALAWLAGGGGVSDEAVVEGARCALDDLLALEADVEASA